MANLIKNRSEYVANLKEFIAIDITDLQSIGLTNVAPGSKCYVVEELDFYTLSPEKEWIKGINLDGVIATGGNGGIAPDIDLTAYATIEYVNERIAFLLNNDSVDVDSINELAKLLQAGGADILAIQEAIVKINQALETKCSLDTFTNYAINSDKKHDELDAEVKALDEKLTAQINNNAQIHNMQAQTDAALVDKIRVNRENIAALDEKTATIDEKLTNDVTVLQKNVSEHNYIIDQIKLGEAMYRAQEVSPVDTTDKNYSIKYDGATLNMQRRTDNNIVAVRLEGDDIVLRKLSGDSIQAEEITYNHSIAGQEIVTNDNRQKPLYLIGLDNYATSASGYKIILDAMNNGVACNSDCSDLNWKDEYANVTPCFRIVDYYYEIVYTNKVPTSLKLLGGFFRKDENDAWTMKKVGSFTDTMHQFHVAFEGNQVTVNCPTWIECNGTYNFIENPEKGISIEGTDKFSFIATETGYKFTVKNLYHSANIDALSGEYDVEIRQYDAWHNGHMDGDNPYIATIQVEYDKAINPCNYPQYYFIKNNDRVLFYKAYNASGNWKSGPFGMTVQNGEFEKTTNINNPNAAVVKYIIDGNLLITGAYEIQEITLDELAAGRGTVMTGVTPYAVNPGTGWGTSDPAVTDNNKRLGMFSYLSNSHDLNKDQYVHPVGNYNVCKLENLPIYTIDGEDVRFLEVMVRGFETSLHGEHWEPDSENGRLYIQFICGRTIQEGNPFRVFYRTLTVGYERNEDGKLSTRRKTWSPLTEIITREMLNAYDSKIVLLTDKTITCETQIAALEEQVSIYEDKYNALEQQYNTLQDTVETLESVVKQIATFPRITVPQEVKLERRENSDEYATIVTGTYSPADATVTLDIIVTDTSIGDGGMFYYITDKRISDGSYEATIKNTPNAAGTPHPSALQATVAANDITVTKVAPITY